MERLDFTDENAVRAWLSDLRARFDDVDALVRDMMRPPWKRELGPVLHADLYQDARGAILDALACAGAPEPDDGDGGPDSGVTRATTSELDADEPPWAPSGGKP